MNVDDVKLAATMALLLAAGGGPPRAPAPEPVPADRQGPEIILPRPASPAELGLRLQQAWSRRDAAAYLALWRFSGTEQREGEARFAAVHFAADEVVLQAQPARPGAGPEALALPAQIFVVNEPRARVVETIFAHVREGDGWAIAGREERPGLDGLIHLTLGPEAYRAGGMKLRFEDFELDLEHGSLFTTPPALGPP